MPVAKKKQRKVRVAFRKNRGSRTRPQNLTHDALDEAAEERLERSGLDAGERLSGKGHVTRQRTVITDGEGNIAVDEEACEAGRVLKAIGSTRCIVRSNDGSDHECTVRRVVRTMERRSRNAAVAGDRVLFQRTDDGFGVIERVEERVSELSRTSGRFAHIIAANVDQVVIVGSAADPQLKPTLIDRFIVAAEKGNMRPVICINKVDLVDATDLVPFLGIYAQLGYKTVLTSVESGEGIDTLRGFLSGNESVFAGQSGVGKSSLLNALQPGLALRTSEVANDSRKGRHTTRVAELRPLDPVLFGESQVVDETGWVVDTPGVRQMDLWDIDPGEVEGYFREFRPIVPQCRFANCTHTHEEDCGIKRAVRLGLIAESRYHGYVRILEGEFESGEH